MLSNNATIGDFLQVLQANQEQSLCEIELYNARALRLPRNKWRDELMYVSLDGPFEPNSVIQVSPAWMPGSKIYRYIPHRAEGAASTAATSIMAAGHLPSSAESYPFFLAVACKEGNDMLAL